MKLAIRLAKTNAVSDAGVHPDFISTLKIYPVKCTFTSASGIVQ
jgi:hypothetical protein